jgi:hypothetical protein
MIRFLLLNLIALFLFLLLFLFSRSNTVEEEGSERQVEEKKKKKQQPNLIHRENQDAFLSNISNDVQSCLDSLSFIDPCCSRFLLLSLVSHSSGQ